VIQPYKRREIRTTEDVWVYRNLMRTDGVWYSLLQRGLVVAHATDVALSRVRFIVREGGRQRVLAEGVKNVHAFVVGRLWRQDPASFAVPGAIVCRGRYNPRRAPTFEYEGGSEWYPTLVAGGARLDGAGLTVWAPT
jgi:hypothetical protein